MDADRVLAKIENWAKKWIYTCAGLTGASRPLWQIAEWSGLNSSDHAGYLPIRILRASKEPFMGGRELVSRETADELPDVKSVEVYCRVEQRILDWTGLGKLGCSPGNVAEKIGSKMQIGGRNSLLASELAYLTWRMYWEEEDFLEGLFEQGRRSVENGDTFRRFHAVFGKAFVPLVSDPRFLGDHVLALAFREMLYATFAVIWRVLSTVGFDLPASAVGRIMRITPAPVIISKELGPKGVLLIWMNHPSAAGAMRQVFGSPDARGHVRNPQADQADTSDRIRQQCGWLVPREGDVPIASSKAALAPTDSDQLLLELI